jgi:hypothetical protein
MEKDINELKAGLKKPRTLTNLEEVKLDAKFNYLRRLREQQEKEAYENAKAKGFGAVEELADEELSRFKSPTPKKGK